MQILKSTPPTPKNEHMAPVFQRLEAEVYNIELTGLELYALMALAGGISGNPSSFPRVQTDAFYRAANAAFDGSAPVVPPALLDPAPRLNSDVADEFIRTGGYES